MCPLLYDIPVIHDQYQIGIPDRRQSVGDYETRPALHESVHRLLDTFFRPRIHRRSGLIEYEHSFVRKHRASDRKELFLAL